MRLIILAATAALSFQVFAAQKDDGAIYSKTIEKVLEKVGTGLVYKDGKPVLRKARKCALFRNSFETEATSRDVLVIGYTGDPIPHNDMGVGPQGAYIGNETFWEAGVFYDVAAAEVKTKIDGGYRWEVCYGKPTGAFASSCKEGEGFESRTSIELTKAGVSLKSEWFSDDGKPKSMQSTCLFN